MGKHIRFDWAIKRFLRQKSNFGILEGFLSELLMEDVKIIEILESESNKETEYDKFNRVDILVKSSTDELMIIEVQNESEHDYFHRMHYAQAKLATQYIYAGEDYDKIKKIISINIVYFELGQGEDYVYKGTTQFQGLHKNDTLQLSNSQKNSYPYLKAVSDIFTTYYIIKVNNFNNVARSTLDEWIYFLKNSEIKNEFRAKGLQEAKEKMRQDNLEGDDRIFYDVFIKEQRIMRGVFKSAIIDAKIEEEEKHGSIIQEKEKEIEEKNQEVQEKNKEVLEKDKKILEKESELLSIIENLKSNGLSDEEISRITNRSIDEIKRIG